MTADVFVCAFCDEYGLDASSVTPASRLVDDLGFDSVDVYDTVLFVEELAGTPGTTEGGYPMLDTVDAAYRYFCELAGTER